MKSPTANARTSIRTSTAPGALTRQALQLATRVLDLAEIYRRPHDMCQATAQVARCLKAMGDFSSAEAYLLKSMAWSACMPGVDARVDLLCELSEVVCTLAETSFDEGANEGGAMARYATLERARDHAFEAASLAHRTADAQWEINVLLRVSDVLNRCGDHDDAASMQDRAISLLGLQAKPDGPADAPADGLRALAPNGLM